jgi:hypothetical protein
MMSGLFSIAACRAKADYTGWNHGRNRIAPTVLPAGCHIGAEVRGHCMPTQGGSSLSVNVAWWNERFAAQAASVGLTEAEAERVFLGAPISDVGARFMSLLAEIAESDVDRHSRIRRLMYLKMEELQKLEN